MSSRRAWAQNETLPQNINTQNESFFSSQCMVLAKAEFSAGLLTVSHHREWRWWEKVVPPRYTRPESAGCSQGQVLITLLRAVLLLPGAYPSAGLRPCHYTLPFKGSPLPMTLTREPSPQHMDPWGTNHAQTIAGWGSDGSMQPSPLR